VIVAYFVGLDLGQSADYTALAVVHSVKERNDAGNFNTFLHLRHLERYPLRTSYTTVADGVVGVMRSEALNGHEYDPARNRIARANVELFVDKTGVGRGVTDIMKERGLRFTGIVIHGGESTHNTDGAYHVPKKDLVAALEVPFDRNRLKIAEGLALWPVLREELQNFRRKQNPKTAHTSFEHWRDSEHDDLVLAVAMACWGATAHRGQRTLRLIR
jgi:hypothetical protein